MAIEFYIPKLGQTVEEVIIASWLVADGAHVEKGQAIIEVETDKAVFPVEANADGILHRGPFKDGDVIPVVTTVAIIGRAAEILNATIASIAASSSTASPNDPNASPSRIPISANHRYIAT